MDSSPKKLPKPIAYVAGVVLMGLAVFPFFYLLPRVEEKLFNLNCAQISAANNLSFEKVEIKRARLEIRAIRCCAQQKSESGIAVSADFDLYSDWLWAINTIKIGLVVLFFLAYSFILRKIGISKYL